MTTHFERSLFDRPVGDFDWGPRHRWKTAFRRLRPLALMLLGLLAVTLAVLRLLSI